MKVLVVIGHQNQGSFCHAIAQTAIDELSAAGHEVVYHDLYAEGFDPVLPHDEIPADSEKSVVVQQHTDELLASDGVVIVHPNWWAMPPAMLKGWLDRVFCQGMVYGFSEDGQIIGNLRGKRFVVFTTSNTPRDVELELYGDPLQNLWETCICGFCGVEDFQRRNFESIVMSTPEQRAGWLEDVKVLIRERFAG